MLWIGLGGVYLVLMLTLGVMSLKKGHWMMFVLGLFFPLFWLIGALLGPTMAVTPPGAPPGTGAEWPSS